MTIYHFDRNPGSMAVAEDFKNKKLHIVCIAVNALTFYNAFSGVGGISSLEAGELAEKVNSSNETGTLWPRLALTIIPLTIFKERDDLGNREIMGRHIKDAFLAHSKYVKSPELLFAFEGRPDFDNKLAMEVLREEAEAFSAEYIPAVYYIPE